MNEDGRDERMRVDALVLERATAALLGGAADYERQADQPRWDQFAASLTGTTPGLLTQVINARMAMLLARVREVDLDAPEKFAPFLDQVATEEPRLFQAAAMFYCEGVALGYLIHAARNEEARVAELERVREHLRTWGVGDTVAQEVEEHIEARIAELRAVVED